MFRHLVPFYVCWDEISSKSVWRKFLAIYLYETENFLPYNYSVM